MPQIGFGDAPTIPKTTTTTTTTTTTELPAVDTRAGPLIADVIGKSQFSP